MSSFATGRWILSRSTRSSRSPSVPLKHMGAFTSTDAWIMFSLLFGSAENGSTLRALIATADYINHAVPTYDELSESLQHLMQAGYVIKRADRYCATPAIRSYYEQATHPRRSINKDWQDVERFLQTIEVTKSITCRRLSRAAYDKAVRAYLSAA
jgi:hypothetical protein